ncbi:MAG TPA: amidohydrolase family protein [Rhizomicrobium sp.]
MRSLLPALAFTVVASIALAQAPPGPRQLQGPPQQAAPAQNQRQQNPSQQNTQQQNSPRTAQPAAPPTNRLPATVAVKPLPAGGPATLIQHGHVYTVGPLGTLNDADVLIQGDKIVQVGPGLTPPDGAKVVNAKGHPVTPGLMASFTQLGIVEIPLGVSESDDSGPGLDLSRFDADADTAGPPLSENVASAAFDVADAINPSSSLIPIARIAGVTRSLTAPAIGGSVFRGQAAVIDLGNGANLIDKPQAAMVVNLTTGNGQTGRPILWAAFRETLNDAREYWADRAGYHRPGGARDQRTIRIDLDALEPVIHGREPLLVNVDRASDIRQIVAYCQTNKLKLIILGGAEAWQVARELAAAQVPVVVDSDLNLPNSFAELGASLKNAARLDAAGVTVVFEPQADDPAHYARTVTQIAGNAVANGMRWDHALAAITRNPAQVWGIADTYGALEPGKDADVVIWDGDPLNVTSAPTAVFIRGQNIPLVSRQTRLRDRYRDLKRRNPPFAYR